MQVLHYESQKNLFDCEKDVLQLGVVVTEKKMSEDNVMGLERNKLSLGAAIIQLKQENEGLSIQLEILERDLAENDRVVEEKSALLGGFDRDIQWVMKDGLVGIVDHVLESLEFGYGVNRFCEACVAIGKALGMKEAKKLVGGGFGLAVVTDDGVDHEMVVEEALDAFASLDYMFVLGLEGLNVGKLKWIVQSRGGASSS
ncbi:unnamed protein product [Lactuca virosa]|uniref:Uncharacterized protein n=1 Tax=Lactuca virosa TaxID=75947 RepID=A0AAU9LKG8_9ASTR|nr:unnamed protein product [Lactuca virosa]